MPGSVPEVGGHRPKSELIDRAAVQLGEVVDPVMITVDWASAAAVWVDGRKECVQALCILAEREHHPEIRWIFLPLDANSTGGFPATYRMSVAPVEGHDNRTKEAIAQAAVAL